MRNLLLASISFIILLSTACTKQQDCCVLAVSPAIAADRNGTSWNAKPETFNVNADTIAIVGRQTEEVLIMKIKFTGKGVYTLSPGQVINILTVGGDVSVAEYNPDANKISTLEIVEYDSTRGIIRGRFNLAMKLHRRFSTVNNSAEVTFTKGTFTQYLPK